MAKEKLIPAREESDDTRDPRERFNTLASRVFAMPKSEIDAREKQWRDAKLRRKKRSV